MNIGNRPIGGSAPCFVIAEAGINHNGSLDTALRMIDNAARAGADCVKFQHCITTNTIAHNAPVAEYMQRTTPEFDNMADLVRQYELGIADHAKLKAHCEERGVIYLCTPFDEVAADELESIGVAAFKIPSGEINNLAYLAHIARKGKPMIVSTGMANLLEVRAALSIISDNGGPHVALLQCTSNYPAAISDANLRAIETMRRVFYCPIGLSDHTQGEVCALTAIGVGIAIYERHFTLDENAPGPDHRASIEPNELGALIEHIRQAESALGNGRKVPAASESNTRDIARKSVVAKRAIRAGETLTADNLTVKRPGTGLQPERLVTLLGKVAVKDFATDEMITLSGIA
jgi:N-acetylneuraminate synthase